MLSNEQPIRSLVSFLVAWSFLVLTVTGLVLYVVPQGRVAYWVHWSLAGLEKTQWGWVHMMFGGLFIVSGAAHLYFNWKPFSAFLAARIEGHLALKREVLIASAISVLLFVTSAWNLPPDRCRSRRRRSASRKPWARPRAGWPMRTGGQTGNRRRPGI